MKWRTMEQLPPTSTIFLVFVRHGESEANEWRSESFKHMRPKQWFTYDSGMVDAPLTDRGREQAEEARLALWSVVKKRGRFDAVYTSPLRRALQTADAIFTPRDDKRAGPETPTEASPTSSSDGRRVPEGFNGLAQFDMTAASILALPELREWRDTAADVGSSFAELEKQFPSIVFPAPTAAAPCDGLPEAFSGGSWCFDDVASFERSRLRQVPAEKRASVRSRIDQFMRRIIAVQPPVKRVCVVGHSLFCRQWSGLPKLKNGEIVEFKIERAELAAILAEGGTLADVVPSKW